MNFFQAYVEWESDRFLIATGTVAKEGSQPGIYLWHAVKGKLMVLVSYVLISTTTVVPGETRRPSIAHLAGSASKVC